MRWRMFFIGWRFDQRARGGFPAPTHGHRGIGDLVPNRTVSGSDSAGFLTIRDAIGDLPTIRAGEQVTQYRSAPSTAFQFAMREGAPEVLENHYAARLSIQNMTRIKALKPGQDWRSLPFELLPEGMQRVLRKDHTRRYRRMQWEGVARSIITRFRDPKSGEYTHPEQHRTISIREAARIQSFPDWFVFEGTVSDQYDQVGNAVPPLLAKSVALELWHMLRKRRAGIRAPVTSEQDGTFSLVAPGQKRPSPVPAWIYVFAPDSTATDTPSPIVISKMIATDVKAMTHWALEVAPLAALGNIDSGLLVLLERRLRRLWPELAATLQS